MKLSMLVYVAVFDVAVAQVCTSQPKIVFLQLGVGKFLLGFSHRCERKVQ